MPLLARRRRTPADPAPLRILLTRIRTAVIDPSRHGTGVLIAWCVAWLLGGVGAPDVDAVRPGRVTIRALQIVPALAMMVPGWGGIALGAAAGGVGGYAQSLRTVDGIRSRPQVSAPDPDGPSMRISATSAALVRVTAWPRRSGRRWRVPAMVVARGHTRTGDARADPRVGDGVLVAGEGTPPNPGTLMAGTWRWTNPSRARIEAGFDEALFMAGRGLAHRGILVDEHRAVAPPGDLLTSLGTVVLEPSRGKILERLDAVVPPRESALLASVLLGRKQRDDGVPREAFGALGLAHLFAVSGLHVGIVAGILLLGVRPLGLGPTWRWLIISCGLLLYVLLTGAASSTVRAATMASAALLAPLLGRRTGLPRLLALTFWGTQVWMPWSGGDVGLRLSFLAVAGILMAGIRPWRPTSSPLRWLVTGLGVSLGAQSATAPVVAGSFGWLAPWAPLANLLAVPWFGAAVWMGVGAIGLHGVPLAGDACALWSWTLLRGLEGGAAALSDIAGSPPGLMPWGWTRWAGWLFLLIGWGVFAGRWRIVVMVLLVCWPFLSVTGRPAMEVLQADVGQGDAAVFLFPDREAVLVDTGECWPGGGAPATRTVLPWLRRRGIDRLAGVVLTHAHADHDGAAGAVAEAMDVERWWLGGRCEAPDGTPDDRVRRPTTGDTLHASGPWALVCLNDAESPPRDHENDRSLALGLYRSGRLTGLWTGDLEKEGEEVLLADEIIALQGEGIVMKAGHHGSRTSCTAELLDAVSPDRILISCGIASRHGHPSHGPFIANEDTIETYRTDLQGSLSVAWDRQGRISVKTACTAP